MISYRKIIQTFKKKKLDFETQETKYTIVIKAKGKSLAFNKEDGSYNKIDSQLMKLIKMVKKDCEQYKFFDDKAEEIRENKIYWSMFKNKRFSDNNELFAKIDLTAAYWTKAINIGLISDKTNDFFNQMEGSPKEKKLIRLKALGALATVKLKRKYVKGKMVSEKLTGLEGYSRFLYMYICELVDTDMRFIMDKCEEIVFYYWDCFFVKLKGIDEVTSLIRRLGFDFKFEDEKVQIKVKKNDAEIICESINIETGEMKSYNILNNE